MTRAQPVSDWRALRELMADEPAAPARQVDELPAPMLPPAPVARVAPIEEEGATMPAAGNAGQPPAAEIERRRPDLSEPAAAPVAPAVKKPVPAEVAAVVPKLKPAISGGGGHRPANPPERRRRERSDAGEWRSPLPLACDFRGLDALGSRRPTASSASSSRPPSSSRSRGC
jgi:hypothetical protein